MLLVGLGALHLLSAILEIKNPPEILYWEPVPEIANLPEWKVSLQNYQKSFLSKGRRVSLLSPSLSLPEDIQLWQSQKSWKIFVFPSYLKLFQRNFVQELIERFQPSTNQSTISHFERTWTYLWLKHYLDNNALLFRYRPQKSYDHLLFLGASPNLEGEVNRIKKASSHSLVLSSDTALGFALASGIRIDAVLSMDSGRGTYFHFIDSLPREIPIFTWLGGSQAVYDLPNPKAILFTNYPLDQYLAHSLGIESQNYGNNLATTAQNLAQIWGIPNFWIAGVSYYSEKDKTHCIGTGYERYHLPLANRKNPFYFRPSKIYRDRERRGSKQESWSKLSSSKPIPRGLGDFPEISERLSNSFPWAREQVLLGKGLGSRIPPLPGIDPALLNRILRLASF